MFPVLNFLQEPLLLHIGNTRLILVTLSDSNIRINFYTFKWSTGTKFTICINMTEVSVMAHYHALLIFYCKLFLFFRFVPFFFKCHFLDIIKDLFVRAFIFIYIFLLRLSIHTLHSWLIVDINRSISWTYVKRWGYFLEITRCLFCHFCGKN